MTKTWCDACGKEITDKKSHVEQIPCHLFSFSGKCGYVDNDMQPISGRRDGIEICTECWNRGWSAFLTKLDLPKDEHITWKRND